jgi:hypothetical protein
MIETVPYNALYRINNGTLPLGELTADNCATIGQDVSYISFYNILHLIRFFKIPFTATKVSFIK